MRRFLSTVLVLVAFGGCAIFGAAEQKDLADHGTTLYSCQAQGRNASAGCLAEGGTQAVCDHAAISTYDACKADGGIQ